MDAPGRAGVTVIPIAQYLVQFGSGNVFDASNSQRDEAPQLQSLDPRVAEELASRLEEAHARALEEGRAAAAAEFDVELAKERARSEAQIAVARQSWLAEEGGRMSDAMVAAFRELETSIADSVARILEPFLAAALREKMLAGLSETLSTLLDSDRTLLKVSGPESFLNALRERLGTSRESIEYLPAEGMDIRATADHTVVETRLQAWSDRFRQAIEA
jgi:hypothetical protein